MIIFLAKPFIYSVVLLIAINYNRIYWLSTTISNLSNCLFPLKNWLSRCSNSKVLNSIHKYAFLNLLLIFSNWCKNTVLIPVINSTVTCFHRFSLHLHFDKKKSTQQRLMQSQSNLNQKNKIIIPKRKRIVF